MLSALYAKKPSRAGVCNSIRMVIAVNLCCIERDGCLTVVNNRTCSSPTSNPPAPVKREATLIRIVTGSNQSAKHVLLISPCPLRVIADIIVYHCKL